jgi:hypothetical protein
MSLYLVEIRLDASTPEKRTQIVERVEQVVKAGRMFPTHLQRPSGVTQTP